MKFWTGQTGKKEAHAGYHHQLDKVLGSMGAAAVGADAPTTQV